MRRLNFHLLLILGNNPVVVLVDSTRKGKLMPDALLKTVPIWCAVVNCIMFGGESPSGFSDLKNDNWLKTPPEMVSRSEHHAIVDRIPGFVSEVTKLQLITKEEIISRLGGKKPIVPQWIYPGNEAVERENNCFSIACLTALAVKPSDWNFTFPYVQGAADDHELWSKHLANGTFDHEVFWEEVYYEHSDDSRVVDMATGDIYLWMSENELIERINRIHSDFEADEGVAVVDSEALGKTGLHLGKISENCPLSVLESSVPGLREVIVLSKAFHVTNVPEKTDVVVKQFEVESSKKGSKQLRSKLPEVVADYIPEKQTLVLCDTGTDLSAGVCLCFLAQWFSDEWKPMETPQHVNKDTIKRHLSRIQDFSRVNPSRNTLQSVNTYLMGSWEK